MTISNMLYNFVLLMIATICFYMLNRYLIQIYDKMNVIKNIESMDNMDIDVELSDDEGEMDDENDKRDNTDDLDAEMIHDTKPKIHDEKIVSRNLKILGFFQENVTEENILFNGYINYDTKSLHETYSLSYMIQSVNHLKEKNIKEFSILDELIDYMVMINDIDVDDKNVLDENEEYIDEIIYIKYLLYPKIKDFL